MNVAGQVGVSADRRFGRQRRLLKAGDYKRVFARSLRSGGDSLLVLARPSGRADARLGLAIAKKHLRLAVARNRVKRIIRESFRLRRQTLRGLDIVVLARPGLRERTPAGLRADLEAHWLRIVALRDAPRR